MRAALDALQSTRHPLSTRTLIAQLKLNYTQGVSLRRALRREALLGRLLCVGKVLDGTFAWTAVGNTAARQERALLGAVLAAEAYLRDHLGTEIALDIEACSQAIGATLSRDPS